MRYEFDNNMLTVYLSGRIDAVNAETVRKELDVAVAAAPEADIVLDARDLEYISSAGLRVLLALQKTKNRKIPVTDVSLEVYEILDITGFNELFDVQKRLREVSVDGYELIGQGASSKVYRINDDTIVKIFDKKIGLERIRSEQKNAKAAFVSGIPTAIALDIVKCGDCYGTMYELIDAVSLSKFIRDNPGKADEYRKKYALLMKELHQLQMPDSFQDTMKLYEKWIHKLDYLISENTKRYLRI